MPLTTAHDPLQYKVLAYDAKKTPVATATMHPNFSFTPAANNYASFYDDAQQVGLPYFSPFLCVRLSEGRSVHALTVSVA